MKPRLLVTLILFSILAWGILPLEAAPPVTLTPAYCGQILYGPTRYQLTADLACPRGANVTLNSATLDMNGHSIMCNSFGPCVKLTGQGSRLMHGAISPFQADGMELVGAGGHQVLDVTIGNTDGTMWVLSPNNTITNVRMVSYVNPAIWVGTDGNRIIQSTAQCIFLLSAGCIDILGDFNAVTGNEVSVGGEQSHLSIKASIHVAGDHHLSLTEGVQQGFLDTERPSPIGGICARISMSSP